VTSGYSGTPLPRKLGIKDGHHLVVLNGPPSFEDSLGELPQGVRRDDRLDSDDPCDVIVLFARTLAQLRTDFDEAARHLVDNGGLWIGWAKKSSPLAGELTGDVVRRTGLAAGLVDNKVCAIDADWSGLRFVYRVQDRKMRR